MGRFAKLSAVVALALVISAPSYAEPHVTLKVSQDKTHYKWDESIRLSYQLIDGTIHPFKDIDDPDLFWVGVRGYMRQHDFIMGFNDAKLSDELDDIIAKQITSLGGGEFAMQASDIPFRKDFHRHVGFSNEDAFFIQRELSVPPNVLRSHKPVYEVGEPITITVSDAVSFLKEDKWLSPDSDERPMIEIWRAPREVLGGATQMPKRFWRSALQQDKGPVKGFSATMNTRESEQDWPFEHKSVTGYLPHGHYDVLLTIRGTLIGRLKGGIEVVGPARESVEAMRLEPQLDDDEQNEQGVPVYDEFPQLLVNDSLKTAFLNQGSVGIYRVGSNGELIGKQYHWAHSDVGLTDRSLLGSQDTGGALLQPGLYEARYYFGGKNNAYHGEMLLQSLRFYLSPKAVEKTDSRRAPPLPENSVQITPSKAGPYHIGENITFELARNEEHDAWDDDVEEALNHSDLFVSVRRLGQYYSNCTYIEESQVALPVRIQKGQRHEKPNPGGALGEAMLQMQDAFVAADDIVIAQDWHNSGPIAEFTSGAAIAQTRHDERTKRIIYEEGQLTINPPDVPGRYAIDIYRRDVDDLNSGDDTKFQTYERLHRYEFALEARQFSGLLSGSVPPELRRSDAYVSQYEARHLLPGGLKTYMFSDSLAAEGPITANRPKVLAVPAQNNMANHDFNVRRAVLNGYLLEESAPFRILKGKSLDYWLGPDDPIRPRPKTPKDWPEQYITQATSWNELVIPKEKWLMDKEACHSEPLPDFTLRLVRLDGARKVKDDTEWLEDTYGLLDFDEMEYEELDDYYLGYPFFIEAEFDAPPASERVRAKVSIAEGGEREVWLLRTQDDARIYRSEGAHFVGAHSGSGEE
jgi:hypothetical protein